MKTIQTLRVYASVPAALCIIGMTHLAAAGDWPRYRGPNGDGQSPEKILTRWPEGGPRVVWKVPTMAGFSSFAVSGGQTFTLVSRELDGAVREMCVAFDADTGKELWGKPLGVATYGHDGGNSGTDDNRGGDGPRSTPSVDGDRVYVMSANLILYCFDAKTGRTIWSKDLMKEHDGKNIGWKNAASPLIEGDLVFVAGGGEGQALLGINKRDGQVAWKAHDDKMTHATPVAATIHGERQVIFLTQKGLVAVAPQTGKELWRYAFPYRVSTAASPVVAGDLVFCSAGYGVGAAVAKIAKSGDTFTAAELWRKTGDKPIANHWSTPVHHEGYLYGMFSFRGFGTGPLKCVELATGKEMWAKEGFGAGNVVLVDGHVLALGDAGQIVLVEASPQAYKEVARVDALAGKCWSTPAVANGRIYVRSTKEGACLDVTQKTVRE